jgi:N-sulfoglucosamine sulfohydrolase
MKMKKIIFLLLVFSQLAVVQKKGNKLPNVLFFIGDDWSGGHASIYGDKTVNTPNFDRIAREGALFTNAFCASPSCTPSRAAILTGQCPHRLEEGGNLWGTLPIRYPNYTDLLEQKGYKIGLSRKGWGPGDEKVGGYQRNPAGEKYDNFKVFYEQKPQNQPFCYWFGSADPHRPYEKDSGIKSDLKAENVQVPPCFPDVPEVRNDLLDYYFEIQRFDREIGEIYDFLAQKGELDNTIVMITSDNGMPFPRAKANIYDLGTKIPLVITWKSRIKGNQVISEMVNLIDLAPTFLESVGLKIPKQVSGKSLLSLLEGKRKQNFEKVQFLERERHAYVRTNNQSYPIRAVRTPKYLYVNNIKPDRYPAGEPTFVFAVGEYGDCDSSPTKSFIIQNKDNEPFKKYFTLAFEKRPAEELYDLSKDPYQLNNIVNEMSHAKELDNLRKMLKNWQKETQDPYINNTNDERWDKFPYYGKSARE